MASLVPTPLDFKEINSLTDATVIDFEKKLKEEIKVFFIEDDLNDVLDALNSKKEEKERSIKVLQSINLHTKPEDELIELMTHREELMRARAQDIIYDRIRNTAIPKQQQMETIARVRASPRCLIATLNTKDLKALHKTIILLISVDNDDFKVAFQRAGGLEALANVLSFPLLQAEPDIIARLLVVVIKMVTIEENRDPFRSANGIERLIPYLTMPNPKISLMATEALLNLSLTSEPNQTLMALSGCMPIIVKNAFSTNDYQTKYENIFLLRNLARCNSSKELMAPEDQKRLMTLLDPMKAYEDRDSLETKQNIAIQKTILEVLFEMSQVERNQEILGKAGLVDAMQAFFLPSKPQVGIRWNFEVLLRVLKITDNLVKFPANREQFLEKKCINTVDQLIINHGSFPEDCLMEAASILTTIATNASANQQAFGKLGLQRLIGLWKQFPTRELMHDLVANMISNVATNQRNRAIVIAENGDKILMTFVKESRVKQVLVKSCLGLAQLCGEVRIVRALVSEKVVPYLVGLLQLNQPELQINVVKILARVADASESGLMEIVRNGGIIPLISLLSDKNWEVRSQALATLKKILFAPGNSGPQNIQIFFQAEGEKPLVKSCLISPSEAVHLTTLEIVFGLMKSSPESRATLFDAGLEISLQKCIEECISAGSKAAEIAKIISGHLGTDISGGAARPGQTAGTRIRALWLKVVCGTQAKLFPLRDSLKFVEFVTAIRNEFKIREWDRLTFRHFDDEIEVTDQRSLNYILSCLQREVPIFVEILPKGNERANKLDLLLQRLTHRQLRVLLKEAIDHDADLSAAIRQCIVEDRKKKDATQAVPERVNIEPLGAPGIGETSQPTPELSGPPPDAALAQPMRRGGPPPPAAGRGGAPPPPPPPKAAAATNRLKAAKANANKGGNLMDQLKSAVALGGGLRRVQLDDEDAKRKYLGDEINKKGGATLNCIGEGCTPGNKLWEKDKQHYASTLQQVLLLDYGMMQVIFKTLQKTCMPFGVLFQLVRDQQKITEEKLAQALLSIGIFVKFALLVIVTGEGTEQESKSSQRKEYLYALSPFDIPMGIVYKTVYRVLKTNGDKRIGGALPMDVDELARKRSDESKQAQAAVPSYSSKKTNRPAQVGSLWDDSSSAPAPAPEPEKPAPATQPAAAPVSWSRTKRPDPGSVGSLW